MVFDFRFRQIDSTSDVRGLIDFMRMQSLGYPKYDDWIQRSEPEIYAGYKQAVLAFSDNVLVGDLVYQPHKQISRILEIKNMRVHPKIRRRDFGHFMLKQVEVEARNSQRYDVLIGDVRASQAGILDFLAFSGFKRLATASLYDSNEQDIVMAKPISDKNSGLIQVASFFG